MTNATAANTAMPTQEKRAMSDIPTLQWLVDWANIGVVAALVASLIAGAASIFLGKKLATLKDEQTVREKQASSEKLAILEKEAADAKRALLEVQERTKDRHLTAEQRTQLIDLLTASPNKGEIAISCVGGTVEPCNFAEEFVDVLTKSGWTITRIDRGVVFVGSSPVGLILQVRSETEAPIYAGVLQKALEKVGIPTPGRAVTHVKKDEVNLLVANKPSQKSDP